MAPTPPQLTFYGNGAPKAYRSMDAILLQNTTGHAASRTVRKSRKSGKKVGKRTTQQNHKAGTDHPPTFSSSSHRDTFSANIATDSNSGVTHTEQEEYFDLMEENGGGNDSIQPLRIFIKSSGKMEMMHVGLAPDVQLKLQGMGSLDHSLQLNELLSDDERPQLAVGDVRTVRSSFHLHGVFGLTASQGTRAVTYDAASINALARPDCVGGGATLYACRKGRLVVDVIGEGNVILRELEGGEMGSELLFQFMCDCSLCFAEGLHANEADLAAFEQVMMGTVEPSFDNGIPPA